MTDKNRALPPAEDRAVVNGAGQAVSALRASVPSAATADQVARNLSAAQMRYMFKLPRPARFCDARSTPALWAKGLLREAWGPFNGQEEWMRYPTLFGCSVIRELRGLICGYGDPRCVDDPCPAGIRWLCSAQAIEARRAETGTGSVHESAVGNADAPQGRQP